MRTMRFKVMRQFSHRGEVQMCRHRWEWTADVCAYRRTAQHRTETGVFYTVRPMS